MWKQRRILDNILWGKLSRESQDIFVDFDSPKDDREIDICREAWVEFDEDVSFEAIKHFALINRLFIDIYYHGRHEERVVEAIDKFAYEYEGKPISAKYNFVLWDTDVNPWNLKYEEEEENDSQYLGEVRLLVSLSGKYIEFDLQSDQLIHMFENFQEGKHTCNAIYLRDLFYHIKTNGKFSFYSESQ